MSAALQSARAVLFDFDGTLADTAPDMARALNRLLQQHGREPAPIERLRPMVSRGARGMVTEGFGIEDTDATYPRLRDAFLDLYHAELVVEICRVYESNMVVYGADKIWGQLNDGGLRVARCTFERLMRQMGISGASTSDSAIAANSPSTRSRISATATTTPTRRPSRPLIRLIKTPVHRHLPTYSATQGTRLRIL